MLLEEHRESLNRLVTFEGRLLLRYEGAEDVVQGVMAFALTLESKYEHRGPEAFRGWLRVIAKQYFSNRSRYWLSRRADAGAALRITTAGGGLEAKGRLNPAGSGTGALTHADRRERLVLAAKAMAVLSERDRALIHDLSGDVSLEETALSLGVTYEAAKKARQRALERFRATAELLQRGVPKRK